MVSLGTVAAASQRASISGRPKVRQVGTEEPGHLAALRRARRHRPGSLLQAATRQGARDRPQNASAAWHRGRAGSPAASPGVRAEKRRQRPPPLDNRCRRQAQFRQARPAAEIVESCQPAANEEQCGHQHCSNMGGAQRRPSQPITTPPPMPYSSASGGSSPVARRAWGAWVLKSMGVAMTRNQSRISRGRTSNPPTRASQPTVNKIAAASH